MENVPLTLFHSVEPEPSPTDLHTLAPDTSRESDRQDVEPPDEVPEPLFGSVWAAPVVSRRIPLERRVAARHGVNAARKVLRHTTEQS